MTIQHDTAKGIEDTIESWRTELLNLDSKQASEKPSLDRWSISEVIGHLVDSACNNHQRFVRAQFCEAFEFPRYEQNEWVTSANYQHCDWYPLVQLWYYYNRQLAALIRNIPASQLATPCTITPLETCTLEFLVTDYLDHLRHHLAKIRERLAVGEAD